ncbi:1-(5-phosphoribosyl)-5-[(5-phosphoribosylamino)methylideneamino]imidazole-4-carboxamide isomerase [Oecophyllibacter saccharovorans]|uniref:1-(5-phosphoribosyl)-5-[(5-phosphoribosylamino)methylideneamino] imidazole-4-carboxamide isomerase n=1 Tax=Oecophyllibacter saccharovorans TaxID=2558360 RepID=A0A506URQ2_9PROT|nr:1-(5-phosphoribosyl)-5-[(5-phosphoribosylamino)methylideneamino]imidazole-4-carboxamide isomerase [Oecophyllibacter saccharovorans]TPW36027.1 1-(5-phosphoribosyl)-5-[(5-phosphoribosylamino)methylideneamino]imidazole-4-carboxamide isomerase [Oecophyllibacter saccharovorans]
MSGPTLREASRVESTLDEVDLSTLTDAACAAILDGATLDWTYPPERGVLERYFNGLVHTPGRAFFVVRGDEGAVCGAGILAFPGGGTTLRPKTRAKLLRAFVAPYARNKGLGTLLVEEMIATACARGAQVLDCEVPETCQAAAHLLEKLGFQHFGTHPCYQRLGGKNIQGLYFTRLVSPASADPLAHEEPDPETGPEGEAAFTLPTPLSPKSPVPMPDPTQAAPSTLPDRPERPRLALYPAIDLKEGACVRLRQGEMSDALHYSDDPAAQARAFAQAGCRHLHVVDLDGAFAGQSANGAAVEAILKATSLPVQLGGGLRDMRSIERWLEAGVSRVILGSAAVKDPGLVRQAARAWPGRIVAGIDARHGRVATEGWAEVSELTAPELALRMEDAGVAAVIFTEITRDGMLEGLDLDQTVDLAARLNIPVIASGGVGTLAHLRALKERACALPKSGAGGLGGVVVGRALYDGRIGLKEALDVLDGPC